MPSAEQRYWFVYWDRCKSCGHFQRYEDAKTTFDKALRAAEALVSVSVAYRDRPSLLLHRDRDGFVTFRIDEEDSECDMILFGAALKFSALGAVFLDRTDTGEKTLRVRPGHVPA